MLFNYEVNFVVFEINGKIIYEFKEMWYFFYFINIDKYYLCIKIIFFFIGESMSKIIIKYNLYIEVKLFVFFLWSVFIFIVVFF